MKARIFVIDAFLTLMKLEDANVWKTMIVINLAKFLLINFPMNASNVEIRLSNIAFQKMVKMFNPFTVLHLLIYFYFDNDINVCL